MILDEKQEIIQLATHLTLAMLAGEATAEESARLDQLILVHPEVASAVLEIVGQENWLAWSSKELVEPVTVLKTPELFSEIRYTEKSVEVGASGQRASAEHAYRPQGLLVAASILLVVGGICGAYLTGGLKKQSFRPEPVVPNHHLTSFSGRILNASACRWSPDFDHLARGGGALRQGESLNLLEGVADVRLEWPDSAANLTIEGPSGVVVTAEGGCNLSHGRLTADVTTSSTDFRLDTPNCQVVVGQKASLGVLVDGYSVEVHAFEGDATVIVPWSTGQLASNRIELVEGNALTLQADSDGNLRVSHGVSNPASFLSLTSMRADRLVIPVAYVQHVQSLAPLLYWRFEGTGDELLASSLQSGLSAQMHGRIKVREDAGNQYLDVGFGISPENLTDYVVSSEPFADEFNEGYSLEMWFKPSHYHLGSLAGMVTELQSNSTGAAHGMLLELGGPRTTDPQREKPGRVRFLHRSPPGMDPYKGTSCFSKSTYALRRWQHVVVVKDQEELRLYIDGRLSSTAADKTRLSSGLRLLIGQIDQVRQDRQFVGQLDEIAFYPRPLSADDILLHYQLVRPEGENQTTRSPSSI